MVRDQIKYDRKSPVDFVIVGAGAAGGIVAKELSSAGFQVVVLEQGAFLKEEVFRHDELAGAGPFDPPRSKPYPLPPLPIKSADASCERAARKLGWHAFPAHMAILSLPYGGRGACLHCGCCEYYGCEIKAKSRTLGFICSGLAGWAMTRRPR